MQCCGLCACDSSQAWETKLNILQTWSCLEDWMRWSSLEACTNAMFINVIHLYRPVAPPARAPGLRKSSANRTRFTSAQTRKGKAQRTCCAAADCTTLRWWPGARRGSMNSLWAGWSAWVGRCVDTSIATASQSKTGVRIPINEITSESRRYCQGRS